MNPAVTVANQTPAVAQSISPSIRANWLIDRRQDLLWFVGSAVWGYLSVALMWAGFPVTPIQFVWFFAIDNPHVMATATRTYFDKAERRKLGPLLWILPLLFLIGPSFVAAGYASVFFLAAFCWQQFHVTKQHFGIMMLYKAKNRDRDRLDFHFDRWFLLTSLFVPLAYYVQRTEARIAAVAWIDTLLSAVVVAYAVLCAAWLVRQLHKLRTGREMNWPKLALLAGVVPLQWLALGFASRLGPGGTLFAAIPLGIFHGLQYHRLMWLHNHNRYAAPEARERNGLAAVLATRVSRYLTVALGLNVCLGFLPLALYPHKMMQAALWGLPFMHYILDARIWHVREDKELAAALNLAPSASSSKSGS